MTSASRSTYLRGAARKSGTCSSQATLLLPAQRHVRPPCSRWTNGSTRGAQSPRCAPLRTSKPREVPATPARDGRRPADRGPRGALPKRGHEPLERRLRALGHDLTLPSAGWRSSRSSPSALASRCTNQRKPTPWTKPWTMATTAPRSRPGVRHERRVALPAPMLARRRRGQRGCAARRAAARRAPAPGWRSPRWRARAGRGDRGSRAAPRLVEASPHPRRARRAGRDRARHDAPPRAATARSRPRSRQTSMSDARRRDGAPRAAGVRPRRPPRRGSRRRRRAASAMRSARGGQPRATVGLEQGQQRAADAGPCQTAACGCRESGRREPGPAVRWRWRRPGLGRGRRRPRSSSQPSSALDGQRRESQSGHARERRSGSSGATVVGTEHEAGRGAGLLEGLEQGVLGVRVQAMGGADDGHAKAALHGRQSQVGAELLDLPEADLLTRALRARRDGGRGGRRSRPCGRPGRTDRAARRDRPAGRAGRRRGRGRASSCRRHGDPTRAGHEAAARCATARDDGLERVAWPCVRIPAGRARPATPARRPSRAIYASSGALACAAAAARRPLGLGLLGRGRASASGAGACAAAGALARRALGLGLLGGGRGLDRSGRGRRAPRRRCGCCAGASCAWAWPPRRGRLGGGDPAGGRRSACGGRMRCRAGRRSAGRLPACQLGAEQLLDLRWDLAPWIAPGCLLDRRPWHGPRPDRAGVVPAPACREPAACEARPRADAIALPVDRRSIAPAPDRPGRRGPAADPAGAARRGGTPARRARRQARRRRALRPRRCRGRGTRPLGGHADLAVPDRAEAGVLGQGGNLVGEVVESHLRLCVRRDLFAALGRRRVRRAHGRAPTAPATATAVFSGAISQRVGTSGSPRRARHQPR